MKISNYFAKEKMDDASFIQTYIEKLNDLNGAFFLCYRFSRYERL